MIHTLTVLAATEEAQGIAALGLNFWTILAQGVTFLVFFILVKKFALGKIVTTLEDRRKTIEDSLDKAEVVNKQNEAAEKRVNELLSDARKESEGIINRSREEAGSIIATAESSAVGKAEKIVADGKLQIEAEIVKARVALKKETLELVATATTALLEEKVDVKKNEALIKRALQERVK